MGFKKDPGHGGINLGIGITNFNGRLIKKSSGMMPIIMAGMRPPSDEIETTYWTGAGAGAWAGGGGGSSACVELI